MSWQQTSKQKSPVPLPIFFLRTGNLGHRVQIPQSGNFLEGGDAVSRFFNLALSLFHLCLRGIVNTLFSNALLYFILLWSKWQLRFTGYTFNLVNLSKIILLWCFNCGLILFWHFSIYMIMARNGSFLSDAKLTNQVIVNVDSVVEMVGWVGGVVQYANNKGEGGWGEEYSGFWLVHRRKLSA